MVYICIQDYMSLRCCMKSSEWMKNIRGGVVI